MHFLRHSVHCVEWKQQQHTNKQTNKFYLLEVENKPNTTIKSKLLPEGYQRANRPSVLAAYDVFMHNWKTFYNINTCNINKNKKILKKQMKKRALVLYIIQINTHSTMLTKMFAGVVRMKRGSHCKAARQVFETRDGTVVEESVVTLSIDLLNASATVLRSACKIK